jgi:hypothetical protein
VSSRIGSAANNRIPVSIFPVIHPNLLNQNLSRVDTIWRCGQDHCDGRPID